MSGKEISDKASIAEKIHWGLAVLERHGSERNDDIRATLICQLNDHIFEPLNTATAASALALSKFFQMPGAVQLLGELFAQLNRLDLNHALMPQALFVMHTARGYQETSPLYWMLKMGEGAGVDILLYLFKSSPYFQDLFREVVPEVVSVKRELVRRDYQKNISEIRGLLSAFFTVRGSTAGLDCGTSVLYYFCQYAKAPGTLLHRFLMFQDAQFLAESQDQFITALCMCGPAHIKIESNVSPLLLLARTENGVKFIDWLLWSMRENGVQAVGAVRPPRVEKLRQLFCDHFQAIFCKTDRTGASVWSCLAQTDLGLKNLVMLFQSFSNEILSQLSQVDSIFLSKNAEGRLLLSYFLEYSQDLDYQDPSGLNVLLRFLVCMMSFTVSVELSAVQSVQIENFIIELFRFNIDGLIAESLLDGKKVSALSVLAFNKNGLCSLEKLIDSFSDNDPEMQELIEKNALFLGEPGQTQFILPLLQQFERSGFKDFFGMSLVLRLLSLSFKRVQEGRAGRDTLVQSFSEAMCCFLQAAPDLTLLHLFFRDLTHGNVKKLPDPSDLLDLFCDPYFLDRIENQKLLCRFIYRSEQDIDGSGDDRKNAYTLFFFLCKSDLGRKVFEQFMIQHPQCLADITPEVLIAETRCKASALLYLFNIYDGTALTLPYSGILATILDHNPSLGQPICDMLLAGQESWKEKLVLSFLISPQGRPVFRHLLQVGFESLFSNQSGSVGYLKDYIFSIPFVEFKALVGWGPGMHYELAKLYAEQRCATLRTLKPLSENARVETQTISSDLRSLTSKRAPHVHRDQKGLVVFGYATATGSVENQLDEELNL